MREMIDCTSSNLAHVKTLFPNAVMWGAYVTGTPDIKYTSAQLAEIPAGALKVLIDQGYGSPAVTTAHVRDVEPGAWQPKNAVHTSNWETGRPTIYCDRNDLYRPGGVLDYGWKGDLWLAIPGSAPITPPAVSGCRVVAVQYGFAGSYDKSVVFDDTWPYVVSVPAWQEEMMQALPTIQEGDSGSYVRSAQGLCIARGQNITVDGIFGPNTRSAVLAIQRAHHVTADGIVGPVTWPILVGV